MEQHIYLTGFMGAGKSMVAKRLSNRLLWDTYDLDHIIEDRLQKNVAQIFKENGEPFFRKFETAEIARLSIKKEPFILSLGGGAFCSEENINLINSNGVSIFLDVAVPILVGRLKRKTHRPLLLNQDGSLKSESEITLIVQDLLIKRMDWYKRASIHIKIDEELTKKETVDLVHEKIKPYLL